MGDIPSGSELPPNPVPLLRAIRPAQIFVLEFCKDGLADGGGKNLQIGGSDNQPVLLKRV